jgi:hypothetical protein
MENVASVFKGREDAGAVSASAVSVVGASTYANSSATLAQPASIRSTMFPRSCGVSRR